MGRNGAFAQNLPAPRPQREIDDGGWLRVAGGASVNNQRNALSDLVADRGGVRTLLRSLQIG